MKLMYAAAALLVSMAAPASAASLQQVNSSDWGVAGLPSYVTMYIYVPDKLATKPPIVVVPHHCQGTASSSYSEMSGVVSVANTNGFIMIFPEATGQNCWDAGSARSLKHDGGGDTQAIVQMVRYVLKKYDGDASRVYSVGGSSGGIMTEALLGVYPDVFMAGISIMGVPCGCWAASYNDVVGKPASGTGQWSGPCAGGTVSNTGEQWADLVRSYFPGYTGHRPRLQHWHGTTDTTLSYKNMAEDVKEWTTLLGLSATPTGTDTPQTGTTRQFWKNACGYTVYETFSLAGVGHAVNVSASSIVAYFGLDKAGGVDPEVAACPSDAGTGGKDASSDAATGTGGTGGTGNSGGASGSGGAGATGGGGAGASGGTSGGAGSNGSGGRSGSGGASTNGGSSGSGGASTNGGSSSANGGNSGPSSGGATGASGGTTGTGGGATTSSGGCSCALGSRTQQNGTAATILLVTAAWWIRRRKRSTSGRSA